MGLNLVIYRYINPFSDYAELFDDSFKNLLCGILVLEGHSCLFEHMRDAE